MLRFCFCFIAFTQKHSLACYVALLSGMQPQLDFAMFSFSTPLQQISVLGWQAHSLRALSQSQFVCNIFPLLCFICTYLLATAIAIILPLFFAAAIFNFLLSCLMHKPFPAFTCSHLSIYVCMRVCVYVANNLHGVSSMWQLQLQLCVPH